MAETWISKLPTQKEDSDLDSIPETEKENNIPKKVLKSTDGNSSTSSRRKRSWFDYVRGKAGSLTGWNNTNAPSMGRFSGAVLNRLVRTGMQTPIAKYLLNPQTLKKALNNDPVLRETYTIILTSDPVQRLMTPEALNIMLDTETAKEVITPENILTLLNMEIVYNFMTPATFQLILESDVVKRALSPEALHEYMKSKTVKNFCQPDVIHEIAYSDVFTGVMTPDILVSFLNTDEVKAIMTREAIRDALHCPGAKNVMNQEMVDKLLGTQGAQNLLDHDEFRGQVLRLLQGIFAK